MKKRINLNWKTIFIECVGLILLISGIRRLYSSTQPILNQRIDELKPEGIAYFFIELDLWAYGTLLLSCLVIGIFKRKIKKSVLDTILATIIVFILFLLGLFNEGFFNTLFNSIGYLFNDIATISALISGIILTSGGFFILRKSINQ